MRLTCFCLPLTAFLSKEVEFKTEMSVSENTKTRGMTVALRWLSAFIRLFYPRRCVVCDAVLQEGEEAICLKCNMDLPRTGYHLQKNNPVEKLFWGKFPIQRASSYFYYRKGSHYTHILQALKYDGRCDIGEMMGRFMAAELSATGFFQGIDVLVPVPLHSKKRKKRGYNQSEYICRGLSAVTGIPVDGDSVVRVKQTETQTHKSAYERWENVDGIFKLVKSEPFIGKHILLVDDVLTTGATLTACADAFAGVKDIRISILTLGLAD